MRHCGYHGLLIVHAHTLGDLVLNFLSQIVVLYNGRLQEEEQNDAQNAHASHDQHIILLIYVSQHECSNQVAENLRSHVE